MSPSERRLFDRITRRAALLQPQLSRRLLGSYALIRDSLTESELVEAINEGWVDRLIDDLMSDTALDPAFASLRELVQKSTIDAAGVWTAAMPSFVRPPMFNVLSPRILDALRTLDTAVMQGLTSDVRKTVRQAVRVGLQSGNNPRVVAKRVRDSIGLSPTQEQAVRNFREQLESGDRAALQRALGKGEITQPDGTTTHRKAHAGGKGLGKRQLATLGRVLGNEPLDASTIDSMVASYRERMLALNAEANTRSMALDSQRLAHRLSWENAIAQGVVQEHELQRVWITVGDGRVRPEHAALNRQRVSFGQRYSNGDLVPGESSYNCRCFERVEMNPAA